MVVLWASAHDGADTTAVPFLTNLRITQPGKMRGSSASHCTSSVELAKLAPQHLTSEVRRVTSGRAFRWFERFPEGTQ